MTRFLLITFFLSILLACPLGAQNVDKNEAKEIVYSKEWMTGLKIHTSGYGLFMSYGKILDRSTKRLFNFELLEIKHPKQTLVRSIHPSGNAQSYYYGKQNSFYNLNVNYLRERVLAEKGRKGAVFISWRYGGGLTLGLLKPYYLNIATGDSGSEAGMAMKYETDGEVNPFFLSKSRILGSAGFFKALDETKIIPGLTLQTSFVFDWAVYNQFIKAVEVGTSANVYYKRVPIMIGIEDNFIMGNLFVKMLFGQRRE